MLRRSVLLLLLITLPLGGCIFFRLSRVIVQMKYPEKYITFDYDDGRLSGTLKDPIAYLSDLETILGQKAIKKGEGHYAYQFKKEVEHDRTPWYIEFWTGKRGKVERFRLPQRLGKVFGKDVLIHAIEAIGYAEVSVRKKTVYLKMKDKIIQKQVRDLMGKPAEIKGSVWKYSFKNGQKTLYSDFVFKKHLHKVLLYSNGYNLELTFEPSLDEE